MVVLLHPNSQVFPAFRLKSSSKASVGDIINEYPGGVSQDAVADGSAQGRRGGRVFAMESSLVECSG